MKYKALVMYNYYDGPIMFTASAEEKLESGFAHNNIFWLTWEDEKEDYSRTFNVYQLTTDPVGKFIEVIHESEIDFSEMQL